MLRAVEPINMLRSIRILSVGLRPTLHTECKWGNFADCFRFWEIRSLKLGIGQCANVQLSSIQYPMAAEGDWILADGYWILDICTFRKMVPEAERQNTCRKYACDDNCHAQRSLPVILQSAAHTRLPIGKTGSMQGSATVTSPGCGGSGSRRTNNPRRPSTSASRRRLDTGRGRTGNRRTEGRPSV